MAFGYDIKEGEKKH